MSYRRHVKGDNTNIFEGDDNDAENQTTTMLFTNSSVIGATPTMANSSVLFNQSSFYGK